MSLILRNITKRYGTRAVVDNVDITVESGTIAALAGVNGSGKSTLLRIAAGLSSHDTGTIILDEQPLAMNVADRVASGVSYLSQNRHVIRGLSVIDTLALVAPREEAYAALEHLRISDILDKRPREMRPVDLVKFSLARVHLQRPRIALIDEPFAGLDRTGIVHCAAILRKIVKDGAGVLVTDHHPSTLLELSSIVHIMKDGKLVYSDTTDAARHSNEAKELYFRARA